MMDYAWLSGSSLSEPTSRNCIWYYPVVFALRQTHRGTHVASKCTRTCGFWFSPITSQDRPRVRLKV